MNNEKDENADKHREAVRRFVKKNKLKISPWCRATKGAVTEGAVRAYLRTESPSNMTLKNLSALADAANVSLSEMLEEDSSATTQHPAAIHQNESDIAIIYVLKMIFHLLLKHQVVSPEGLDFNFTEASDHYRKHGWQHAANLIEKFRTFVTEEPHQLEKEAIRRLLELEPLGRA